jgi:hypothetical protein
MHRNPLLAAVLVGVTVGITPAAEQPGQVPASPAATPGTQDQGPDESDLRTAYTNKINSINAGTKQYPGAKAAAQLGIRLVKVNLVECDPLEERRDLYQCTIVVESAVGDADPALTRLEVVLIKDNDTWRVL